MRAKSADHLAKRLGEVLAMRIVEATAPDFDLDRLLDDVERDEVISIAREGGVVALMGPVFGPVNAPDTDEAPDRG
jgi:hypothetical protein